MNSPDIDQPQPDLPGGPTSADAAVPAKPRRKRSPAAVAGEAVAPVPVVPAEVPSLEAVFAPKRGRRKVADAVPVAAAPLLPEPAPEPIVAPAEVVKVAKPRRRTAVAAVVGVVADIDVPAAVQAAASVAPATVATAAAAATAPSIESAVPPQAAVAAAITEAAAPLATGNDEGAPPAETEAGDAGDGPEADGPRRRNRNRRRGRRSVADRALREDGSPADEPGLLTITANANATSADDEDDDDDERPVTATVEPPRAAPVDAGETFAAVLSGDYDAEPADAAADPAAEPERRVLAAEPDAPKLHKVLAQAGIGSRRDMEELIAEGQVMVNGQAAHTGQRISFGDRISVAGKLFKVRIAPPPPRIIAYHKPVGEVVTNDDPQNRPTVYRRLPRLPHGKWQSVGRLDINTEGLLLFTNSGELANQLMHPRFGVEREYAVRVLGTLETEGRKRLLDGVEIDGQRASFKAIEDGGGEGVNRWYRVVITEGRNREVRKLFDKVGLGVSRLIRIRYGCVVLPRGLRRGLFVDLNETEVREVRRLAVGGRDQAAAGSGPRPPRPEAAGQQAAPVPREGPGPGRGNNNRHNAPPQSQRADRPDRPGPRPPSDRPPQRAQERRERSQDRPQDRPFDPDRDTENFAAIPNPLMQTFDKRAIREARQPRREIAEDGPIPNPLEQTYDKRFVQKPRGFGSGGDGGGRKGGGGGGAGGGQPDPMKTSLGYIGADAFVRKFQGNGGGGGGGGGRRGGGGSGGGGGGGGGRRGGGGR